jgi:hypothetical protein
MLLAVLLAASSDAHLLSFSVTVVAGWLERGVLFCFSLVEVKGA